MIANAQNIFYIVLQTLNKIDFCQNIFASMSILVIFATQLFRKNIKEYKKKICVELFVHSI
jgi:hypothetical protein